MLRGLTSHHVPNKTLRSESARYSKCRPCTTGIVSTGHSSITFQETITSGLTPKAVLSAGIAHVPEGRRLFKGLSVEDNLLIGSYIRESNKSEIKRDLEFIYEIFPRLRERHQQDASTLSGGEQQMCAIGRGLMSKPKLLIIDELSLGLAPKAVDQLVEALCQLNRNGLTILLVEQDVFTALEISKRAYVIESGRIAISGLSKDLHDNPKIQEAYLGM